MKKSLLTICALILTTSVQSYDYRFINDTQKNIELELTFEAATETAKSPIIKPGQMYEVSSGTFCLKEMKLIIGGSNKTFSASPQAGNAALSGLPQTGAGILCANLEVKIARSPVDERYELELVKQVGSSIDDFQGVWPWDYQNNKDIKKALRNYF